MSGFIQKMSGKPGASIMADRGFTIKDQLAPHGVGLNILPFMEGQTKLPAFKRVAKINFLLVNFQQVLIPCSISEEVNEYFQTLSDSDYDADTEDIESDCD